MIVIYKLIDPRTSTVMYVGKTSLSLKNRLHSHIHVAKKGNTPKDIWIRDLLLIDKTPLIEILEVVTIETWQQKEQYWIEQFKYTNSSLLNIAVGGSIGGVYLTPEKQQQVVLLQSEAKSKPVYQLDFSYHIIKVHNSCRKAAKELSIADTGISTAARSLGKKSAGGFLWCYIEDLDKIEKCKTGYSIDYSYLYTPVKQLTKEGLLIKQWSSLIEAAKVLGIRRSGISRAKIGERKSYKGFLWT